MCSRRSCTVIFWNLNRKILFLYLRNGGSTLSESYTVIYQLSLNTYFRQPFSLLSVNQPPSFSCSWNVKWTFFFITLRLRNGNGSPHCFLHGRKQNYFQPAWKYNIYNLNAYEKMLYQYWSTTLDYLIKQAANLLVIIYL